MCINSQDLMYVFSLPKLSDRYDRHEKDEFKLFRLYTMLSGPNHKQTSGTRNFSINAHLEIIDQPVIYLSSMLFRNSTIKAEAIQIISRESLLKRIWIIYRDIIYFVLFLCHLKLVFDVISHLIARNQVVKWNILFDQRYCQKKSS